MPNIPKPNGQAERPSIEKNTKVIDIDGYKDINIPKPPTKLLKVTKDFWNSFWKSDLANFIATDTDIDSLSRLVKIMDDRERAWRRVRSEGFSSIGSQGQEILHPLVRQINQWDKDILALQDRFGLNPKSRLQLGISLNNAKKTTLDLQKEFSINIDDEEWYAETD